MLFVSPCCLPYGVFCLKSCDYPVLCVSKQPYFSCKAPSLPTDSKGRVMPNFCSSGCDVYCLISHFIPSISRLGFPSSSKKPLGRIWHFSHVCFWSVPNFMLTSFGQVRRCYPPGAAALRACNRKQTHESMSLQLQPVSHSYSPSLIHSS